MVIAHIQYSSTGSDDIRPLRLAQLKANIKSHIKRLVPIPPSEMLGVDANGKTIRRPFGTHTLLPANGSEFHVISILGCGSNSDTRQRGAELLHQIIGMRRKAETPTISPAPEKAADVEMPKKKAKTLSPKLSAADPKPKKRNTRTATKPVTKKKTIGRAQD